MRYFYILVLIFCYTMLNAQLEISLESGLVTTQYNDVRVPNGDVAPGTLFSFTDDFEPSGWSSFLRGELSYRLGDRHVLSLVAAPLTVSYTGLQLAEVNFAGNTFTSGNTDGSYQFNTYRASYRYGLVRGEKWTFDIGATVLVRDAEIKLTRQDVESTDDDLGYVPLVSFDLRYRSSDKLQLVLKGDALVGPVGRAEDIFAGLHYQLLADKLALKAGYRVIEGGADVDQVYNFAFFHFANLGLVLEL